MQPRINNFSKIMQRPINGKNATNIQNNFNICAAVVTNTKATLKKATTTTKYDSCINENNKEINDSNIYYRNIENNNNKDSSGDNKNKNNESSDITATVTTR